MSTPPMLIRASGPGVGVGAPCTAHSSKPPLDWKLLPKAEYRMTKLLLATPAKVETGTSRRISPPPEPVDRLESSLTQLSPSESMSYFSVPREGTSVVFW